MISSIFENIFAWVMIAGGLAILVSVRWRPMKLWTHRPRKGARLFGGARRDKPSSSTST